MSRPKKSSAGAGTDISDKKLRGLWKQITAAKFVELLRLKRPDGKWSHSGHKVTGRCPYHDDNTPSFSILLDRGFGKCFGCDTFVSNPISFWSVITGLPAASALGDLKQHFNLDSVADATGTKLAALERAQRIKREIIRISHQEMLNAVNEPNNPDYVQMQAAVKYLLDVRKIPPEALPSLHTVGVLPPLIRIVQALDAATAGRNAVEEARAAAAGERPKLEVSLATEVSEYLQGAMGWAGSLVFSMDRGPDHISRIKLRRPNSKDFIVLADEQDGGLGFFGLTWSLYRPLLGSQQGYHAPYIVEGEFDALSIMAQQVLAGVPSFMVLAAGGTAGAANIDDLYDLGFDTVNLVGDAPTKKGDDIVQQWLNGVDKLHARIFCGYSKWPGSGDPDDAVVKLGYDVVRDVLLDINNAEVFKTPPRWLLDGVQDEILATPSEQRRRRIELASAVGKTLRNKIDREDFVLRCHELFDIPVGALKRDMSTHTDTQQGFVYRVAEELERLFFIIGVKRDGNKQTLKLWHRQTKHMLAVNLNDPADAVQVLAPIIGTLPRFFEDEIGIPDSIEIAINSQKGGIQLQKMNNALTFFLNQALLTLAHNATDCGNAKSFGQGMHRIDKGHDCELYFVNGQDVYHGYYENDVLKWRELEGPSDNGYVFNVDPVKWAKDVHTVDDLRRATSIDLAACVAKLHDILSLGWTFRNQATSARFLAYHLAATTVSAAFDRKVIMAFHADTGAGKSKLLLGLIAGLQDQAIHLIEAAIGTRSFSPAGFKQEMHEKSLAACIDEFEDDKSSKTSSAAVENLQTMVFRGIQHGNNVQRIGTRSGQAAGYSLNFFVFIAAIHRARNPQDANRVVQISMEKIDGRESPEKHILTKYTEDELQQLRYDLTVALLPHAKTLRDNFRALDKELTPEISKTVKIEDRFKSGLLPALSVMKLLGLDYKQFLIDFCSENADLIVSTGSRTDSLDIFDWITQSALIPVDGTNGKTFTSFLALLATPESRALVNESGTGLFYDEPTQMLVVNWTMATQSVLKNHPRFSRSSSHQNLRELANRVAFSAKTPELEGSGALQRLRKHGLYGIPAHQLTAYKLGHLIQQEQVDIRPEKNATVIPLPQKTNDTTFG